MSSPLKLTRDPDLLSTSEYSGTDDSGAYDEQLENEVRTLREENEKLKADAEKARAALHHIDNLRSLAKAVCAENAMLRQKIVELRVNELIQGPELVARAAARGMKPSILDIARAENADASSSAAIGKPSFTAEALRDAARAAAEDVAAGALTSALQALAHAFETTPLDLKAVALSGPGATCAKCCAPVSPPLLPPVPIPPPTTSSPRRGSTTGRGPRGFLPLILNSTVGGGGSPHASEAARAQPPSPRRAAAVRAGAVSVSCDRCGASHVCTRYRAAEARGSGGVEDPRGSGASFSAISGNTRTAAAAGGKAISRRGSSRHLPGSNRLEAFSTSGAGGRGSRPGSGRAPGADGARVTASSAASGRAMSRGGSMCSSTSGGGALQRGASSRWRSARRHPAPRGASVVVGDGAARFESLHPIDVGSTPRRAAAPPPAPVDVVADVKNGVAAVWWRRPLGELLHPDKWTVTVVVSGVATAVATIDVPGCAASAVIDSLPVGAVIHFVVHSTRGGVEGERSIPTVPFTVEAEQHVRVKQLQTTRYDPNAKLTPTKAAGAGGGPTGGGANGAAPPLKSAHLPPLTRGGAVDGRASVAAVGTAASEYSASKATQLSRDVERAIDELLHVAPSPLPNGDVSDAPLRASGKEGVSARRGLNLSPVVDGASLPSAIRTSPANVSPTAGGSILAAGRGRPSGSTQVSPSGAPRSLRWAAPDDEPVHRTEKARQTSSPAEAGQSALQSKRSSIRTVDPPERPPSPSRLKFGRRLSELSDMSD